MAESELIPTNLVELGSKALSLVEEAMATEIRNNDEYALAGKTWADLQRMKKLIEAAWDPVIEDCHRAHKTALRHKAEFFNPTDNALRHVKRLIVDYDLAQELKRKAEEARLAELAKKDEEERRLMDAIIAEEAGDPEEAQAILEEPVYVPPISVPKVTPKLADGPVVRTVWDFEIVDLSKLPREYMVPDLVKIRRIVTGLQGKIDIPGVRAYTKKV